MPHLGLGGAIDRSRTAPPRGVPVDCSSSSNARERDARPGVVKCLGRTLGAHTRCRIYFGTYINTTALTEPDGATPYASWPADQWAAVEVNVLGTLTEDLNQAEKLVGWRPAPHAPDADDEDAVVERLFFDRWDFRLLGGCSERADGEVERREPIVPEGVDVGAFLANVLMAFFAQDGYDGDRSAQQKWLLVNIQSPTEFASQQLNADTWTDETLRAVVNARRARIHARTLAARLSAPPRPAPSAATSSGSGTTTRPRARSSAPTTARPRCRTSRSSTPSPARPSSSGRASRTPSG